MFVTLFCCCSSLKSLRPLVLGDIEVLRPFLITLAPFSPPSHLPFLLSPEQFCSIYCHLLPTALSSVYLPLSSHLETILVFLSSDQLFPTSTHSSVCQVCPLPTLLSCSSLFKTTIFFLATQLPRGMAETSKVNEPLHPRSFDVATLNTH